MNEEQDTRLEALKGVAPLARKTKGPFGPMRPGNVPDVVDLAEYVVSGVHPWDRFRKDQDEHTTSQDA